MENQSAQTWREFKSEYFVLAAAFQREPFSFSNLPSGGDFFALQMRASHALWAKAIGLSGYDCMQNINWKWDSAGFLRNLTRKDQRIWKEPTARKSEIIIGNMEPEKYSNNTKTTACDVRRLYNGEQTWMHVFNTMEILETSCECPWSSPKGPCDAISELAGPKLNPGTEQRQWVV